MVDVGDLVVDGIIEDAAVAVFEGGMVAEREGV